MFDKVVLSDNTEFLDSGDKRLENYRLAMRLFLSELRGLKIDSVERIFKRWSVAEIAVGDSVKVGISFPDDLERYQWFRTEGWELKKIVPETKKVKNGTKA